jgi:hypothetical protein
MVVGSPNPPGVVFTPNRTKIKKVGYTNTNSPGVVLPDGSKDF